MRILVLTQKLPGPVHDGYNLRTAAYLPRLAARHRVELVSLDVGHLEPALAGVLAGHHRLPERPLPKASPFRRLAAALSPDELHDFDPEVMAAIEGRAAEFRPDAIWSVGWRMLPYALELGGARVLADVVDEGAREAWLDFRAKPSPRRLVQWIRVVRFERRHFPRAARVLFVSDQDVRATERVAPRARCELLPNGVDVEFFAPAPGPVDQDLLVFEGAMSHVPNREAVLFFAREVLPGLRLRRPGTRLLVVGRDPGPELLALSGPDPARAPVEFTGTVADVRPHVRRAAVFVSPMVGGAGLKNKVLQAWAMGKAVVATTLSVGGLDARDGEELAIADGPAALADAVLRVLQDSALRQRLEAGGRRAAVERFSWDRAAERLEEHLCAVAAGAGT